MANATWPNGNDNVVLVSGEGYADAISASALAKKLDAPILLTTPDILSVEAKDALDSLKAKNIYVIGETASISQKMRDSLKNKYTLIELGGNDRYETNVKVADMLVKLGVSPSNVLVVGGEGYSDALSVIPIADAKGEILLLANNEQDLTQPAINFVKANKSNVTVIGTDYVIDDATYDAFGATTRINGGSSRFDTNLCILNKFKDDLCFDRLYVANASPTVPDNMYADALVASAAAGKYLDPLVLIDKDESDATSNAMQYIRYNALTTSDLELVGGTKVISKHFEDIMQPIYIK